jgi:hypothetical protein
MFGTETGVDHADHFELLDAPADGIITVTSTSDPKAATSCLFM